MKAIRTEQKIVESDYRGPKKPKYRMGQYMRVYCGSYQDHEFSIKGVRFNHDRDTFEYLYDGTLMGGWYAENSIVPGGGRAGHYDSRGYCDNPGRGY